MSPRLKAAGFPQKLANSSNRIIRPQDVQDVYARPESELRRLERAGLVRRLAKGYYLRLPDQAQGRSWTPEVEPIALGIGVAVFGRDHVCLMGPSAARLLGVLPRALATATVAVPNQHALVETSLGRVRFVKRSVEDLDRQRSSTAVTDGWVTTAEQTILDVAARPTLGDVTSSTATEIIERLSQAVDWSVVIEIAARQHRTSALARAGWIGSGVSDVPSFPKSRRPVKRMGLRATSASEPARFGIEDE